MSFWKKLFSGGSKPTLSPAPKASQSAGSLELPPEFDGKMSYRDMFRTRTPEQLHAMCRALPVERLNLNRPGISSEMGRAVTQIFAVSTYMATKEVPPEFGDILFPRLVGQISKYNGADLHLEIVRFSQRFRHPTSGRRATQGSYSCINCPEGFTFLACLASADICLFASLNNIALETNLRPDFMAALEAAQQIPASQMHEIGGDDAIKSLKQEMEASAPAAPQQSQKSAISTPSKSDYWNCPKCGGLLQKGVGAMFAETIGVATCGGCGAKFSQSDVYGGKYDVEERTVDPAYKFRIIGSTAFWGNGHQITFNNEYTSVERNWLLDGKLYPVSSTLTKAELRELVEGNFLQRFQVELRSSQQFNLPKPKESNGYNLAIIKLFLSYAVRNNVAFAEAIRIYETRMADG